MSFVKDYLSFTKKERTGIIALLILIIGFSLLPFLFPLFIKKKKTETKDFEKQIASLQIKQADSTKKHYRRNLYEDNSQSYYQPPAKKDEPQTPGELFFFDPNTASSGDWKRLGVKEKTVETIQKYISKGGRFNNPEDIRKIWGIHEEQATRMIPYIQIKSAVLKNNFTKNNYDKPTYTAVVIDVNTADTTALIALPGIGSKLSNRIINFRDKLGGFYKLEQVAETFGLPDSTFQKIRPRLKINNTTLRQININSVTIDELKLHPYFRYTIANAVIQYRNQHGKFSSVSEIKKVTLVTENVYNKIFPYLKVE